MLNLSASDFEASSDGSVEERTETHDLYSKLMKHPDFLLSMQPRMVEGADGDGDEEEEDDGGEDLKISANLHAESFIASS